MTENSHENKLKPRQKLFCIEYLKDFNATQAAVRAGYSRDTAAVIAHENLIKPNIQNEISAQIGQLLKQAKIPLEKQIYDYWVKRAFYDITEIIDVKGEIKLTERQLRKKGLTVCIDSINKRVNERGIVTIQYKFADKDKAVEMLQKYIQMIKEKIDLNVTNISIGKPPLPEDAYPD